MNWMCSILILVFVMSVSGGALSLAWKLLLPFLQSRADACRVYTLLKSTVWGYLLPVPVLLKELQPGYCSLCSTYAFAGVFLLFDIWCAGMVWAVVRILFLRRHLKWILQAKIPVSREEEDFLRKLTHHMGIRRRMRICRCYRAPSPCICGILKPMIILPVTAFKKEELEMILYHELVHLKKRDELWKMVFEMMGVIFWFMPSARVMKRELSRWAEAECDELCCRRYPVRKYFGQMMEMLAGDQASSFRRGDTSINGKGEFYWRVTNIVKNREKETS